MNNNDPFDLHDDEKLPPELADFESRLKSLKPVADDCIRERKKQSENRDKKLQPGTQ